MPVTILTFLFSSVLACDMAGGLHFVSFTDQANECTLLTVWQVWQVCRDGAAAGGTWRFNLGNSSPVFLFCLTRVCQVMSGMQMYFGSLVWGGKATVRTSFIIFGSSVKWGWKACGKKKKFISVATGEATEAEGMAKTGPSSSFFSDGERRVRAEGLSQHGTALCEVAKWSWPESHKGFLHLLTLSWLCWVSFSRWRKQAVLKLNGWVMV